MKIFLLVFGLSALVCAEDPVLSQTTPTTSQKSLREQLVERLTKRDGTPASIVIVSGSEKSSPLENEIARALESAVRSYGRIDVRREAYQLPAMNMEEMRATMARFQADVLLITVIKSQSADVFLFDRRTPYQLYSHSEQLPDAPGRTPVSIADEVTRLLTRRILYRYLNQQYFELPREESLPVLRAEIPQWVASEESLQLVNRELTSRFYLNVSLGAALNMGRSGQLWNSHLIGIQMGLRLFDKVYLEAQLSAFSYNAFVGSLRYTFVNRNSPFRVNVGAGFAFVTRDKVWNLDQTLGLGRYSYYFVPSASLLFPIGEVYLKMEGQFFFTPSFDKFIWTFMPGIQVHF